MANSDDASAGALPTGAQIHDKLMQPIEPDLVTTNLSGLQEKYKDESSEERTERAVRYAKAIEQYDAAATAFFAKVDIVVDKHRDQVLEKSNQADSNEMGDIEEQINEHSPNE